MAIPVPKNVLPPFLRESEKVIYSDGDVHGSLYWLSFCQVCKKLRNRKGMLEEIEMHRCTACSETFTITENSDKEKGCPVCFECPCCGQTLVVRTALLPLPVVAKESVDEKAAQQEKRFHLVCQTCRWSSRAAGIPDATRLPSISSPWRFKPDTMTPQDPREEMTLLSDYYRAVSIPDKVVPLKSPQKSKRLTKSPAYPSVLGDKYKLVSVAQKRISSGVGGSAGLATQDLVVLEAKLPKPECLSEAAMEEVEEEELLRYLSEDQAEKRLDWKQRLQWPGEQPEKVDGLAPRRKPLASKLVWKCRSCLHIMCKMDYTAQTYAFKMNSSAPLLVPTIQPCKPAKFVVGQVCEFVVVIRNPLGHDVHMSFTAPLPDEESPAWIDGMAASNLTLPKGPVILLNRACAADEKSLGGTDSLTGEDSSAIAFRKLYTVGLRFSCVPLSAESDTWVSFYTRYDFLETQTTVFTTGKSDTAVSGDTAAKEPITTWISLRIDMNLGRAAAK
ncbi:putative Dynactin subunit 4 [Hypsibius exemplaris]|uniref:Dynactin subunit 4 n=1 Tax=Hypsibius exemplaris TaxID=2072580 RepID=A0A1W0WC12_HYPEX|nr:putative Dynactin subunit 4 [Hypsibius exemplaris]